MKIIGNKIHQNTLSEFADRHGLVMVVNERPPNYVGIFATNRYYASFENIEVKDENFLTSTYGDGCIPEYAIMDYCSKIRGKLLVFGAYTDKRKEFWAPEQLYFNGELK